MNFELIALSCTALFAGACMYVSVVKHPARLACGIDVALAEWRPSHKRAAVMQVLLALVAFSGAVAAYATGQGSQALLGGALLIAVVPRTLLVIMPTNRKLLDPARTREMPDTGALLRRWVQRHHVRTPLSIVALVVFAVHLARQQ